MAEPFPEFKVVPRPNGSAYLKLTCQHTSMGHCLFPLWRRPAEGTMWQWNGDMERPTITPSIDCKGGCGRHFTITGGVAQ